MPPLSFAGKPAHVMGPASCAAVKRVRVWGFLMQTRRGANTLSAACASFRAAFLGILTAVGLGLSRNQRSSDFLPVSPVLKRSV